MRAVVNSTRRQGSFSSDSTLLSTPSMSRCSSVEDATLNELGRFDESYTYDKETDILSDSDATDCEAEQTTIITTVNSYSTSTTVVCDSELDFIDVDSSGGQLEAYHITCNQSEFRHLNSSAASSKLKRGCRVQSPALRPNNGTNSPSMRSVLDSPALRARRVESPVLRSLDSPSLRARGLPALRPKKVESPTLQNGRVESSALEIKTIDSPGLQKKNLVEGFSTPQMRRRPEEGSNCSTPRAVRRESNCSTPVRKAPSNLLLKKPLEEKYSESERKLIEADKEADRKYRQLIKEAESLLVHIRNVAVEEVDLETPTIEMPQHPFPQPPPRQTRPDPGRLQIMFPKGTVAPAYPAVTVTTPSGGPPRALVTFRSVDLNSPVAAEASYCPQSEPVKRKVYSSAALQRLQDHFKLTEMDESGDSSPPEADESSCADKEPKSPSPSQEECSCKEERRNWRQEARAQYKLAIARKNNVVNILEDIKLNLQMQSARLHDVYRSTTDLRSPCFGDITPSPLKANIPFGPLNTFAPVRRSNLQKKHH